MYHIDDLLAENDFNQSYFKYEYNFYKNNFEKYTTKVKSSYRAIELINDKNLLVSICKDKIKSIEEPDRFFNMLSLLI